MDRKNAELMEANRIIRMEESQGGKGQAPPIRHHRGLYIADGKT